jgi:hypothetical protein
MELSQATLDRIAREQARFPHPRGAGAYICGEETAMVSVRREVSSVAIDRKRHVSPPVHYGFPGPWTGINWDLFVVTPIRLLPTETD